ncbi:MAG: aspartate aminotransferase family protein [Candidatus Hodarchaeota archaeon]
MKIEEFENLRHLVLKHVWVPLRAWNVMNDPDGFNIFIEGKGCRLTDINGKTYIDYRSGLGNVTNLGYGRKEIAEAVYEQIKRLDFRPTHDLTIPQIKVAKKLADITPGSLSKTFFASSGTEAIETAIKIARKYQRLNGSHGRYKIIVGGYRYHGSTYGSMSLGWRGPDLTWGDFETLLPGVVHVPSPYCHLCDLNLRYPACDIQCAKEIDRVIQCEGPETVAAFLDVTIATEYSTAPPPEYWPMVRSICNKYGILLILDEVMVSFGRTGKMFACEHWDIAPDIMAVAKSLTNGSIPIGATIATREVAQKFEGGYAEMLKHSYTFEGHPVASAAALATLNIMEKENILENSRIMGEYFFESLQSLRTHRIVGEVRGGLGLDSQVEFVKDKKTNEKFSSEENRKLSSVLREKLRQAGLWGSVGNPLQLKPPLIITKDEINEIVSGLDKVIGDIEKKLSIS